MESGKMMGAVLGAVVKAAAAILVIFLLFKGADVCYDYGYRIFAEPAMTEGEGTVVTSILRRLWSLPKSESFLRARV